MQISSSLLRLFLSVLPTPLGRGILPPASLTRCALRQVERQFARYNTAILTLLRATPWTHITGQCFGFMLADIAFGHQMQMIILADALLTACILPVILLPHLMVEPALNFTRFL